MNGLRDYLDQLHREYDARYLSPDPLEFLHRFDDPADIEVFGFYAAGLAYGRVSQIRATLEKLARILGPHPARFVTEFEHGADRKRFRGFVHRFHGPRDLSLLTELLHRALNDAGTLGRWFARGDDASMPDIGPGLADFCRRMTEAQDLPGGPGVHRGRLAPRSPVRYFFSSPDRGSACKRLNLYLRWMVRRRDGLDFGLWKAVSPSRLIIPLDTHVARISRYIGLTSRNTADWRMALEVTAGLRQLDPVDPIRYDFALSRLGILDYCPRRRDAVKCAACLIQPVCTL